MGFSNQLSILVENTFGYLAGGDGRIQNSWMGGTSAWARVYTHTFWFRYNSCRGRNCV